jgi:uncharacterized protein YaiI (UPF0178 family)
VARLKGGCVQIWVDADACPGAVKEILYRAAERVRVTVTLVANQLLQVPATPHVKSIRVSAGFDVADRQIARLVRPGDLVVTADIPLAAEIVERGALALDPRGELYTPDNISERLAVRNLMDELRSVGLDTGGPASYGKSERQAFANQLDRLLTRYLADRDARRDDGYDTD